MSWRAVQTIAAATAIFGAGCGPEPRPGPSIPDLDRDVFRESVQPVLAARCGNPSTCHGREDRPFALYVRGANRAQPQDVFRDPPLSEEELDANYERTRCFTVGAEPAGTELLAKPLAESVSGVWHRGGDVFVDTRDREYQVLEAWILTDETEEPP